MKMKRIYAMLLALLLTIGTFSMTALADTTATDETVKVYVSISDDKGKLVLPQATVTVTDVDKDGTLTINDAFYAAHEAKYEGGAAAGYASSEGQYGMKIDKLWGVAAGSGFGYYVNNQSAMSLGDEVKRGDFINAFVYTDTEYWSDTYCYFDKNTVTAEKNEDISLTLSAAGYDPNWNPITVPVEGATITINGGATEYKTNAEGKVTVKIKEVGTGVISAISATQTLVPPVCVINPTAKAYVTIADEKGELALAQEEIVVSDVDKDGAITINDALYAAHEAKYEGGAAAGYKSYVHQQFGLSLSKLWGSTEGSGFGYYVNNQSAWSLADAVMEGDYVNAFVYTDTKNYSDTYCYFDINEVTAKAGEKITITLSALGYDGQWNTISVPVKDATITINGEKTTFKTNEKGQATIVIDKEGQYIISAVSDSQILVSPVCKAVITAADPVPAPAPAPTVPKTGDSSNGFLFAALAVVSLAGVIVFSNKGKKVYEK